METALPEKGIFSFLWACDLNAIGIHGHVPTASSCGWFNYPSCDFKIFNTDDHDLDKQVQTDDLRIQVTRNQRAKNK